MKNLQHLTFASALDLALGESKLCREDVGNAMGWSASKTSRIFNAEDNYYPTMPSIPRLCTVLGNDVILDWLRINTNELRLGKHDCAPKLSQLELLQLLSEISKEVGDVNREINKALSNDNTVDKSESKRIIREAYDVLSRYRELIAAMRAI